MVPFKKSKKNYFALLFSDREIQLAQTDRKGKPVVLSSCQLEEGVINRGKISKPESLAETLRLFLAKNKAKTKFVVVGLPEMISFSRVVVVPDLPAEEIDDAVRWEVEPLLPMPIRQAYLDWMILSRKDREVQALVMALPMGVVDEYAAVLEKLGYQLVAFEPTSLCLARFAQTGVGDQLILEVKKEEAVLVVVGSQGEIHLSSTVAYAEGKREEEVLETIGNAVRFYQRREGKEASLAKILVCGGEINEALLGAIQKRTGLGVESVPVAQQAFASVISLAQKNVAAPRDSRSVNLIPPRIQGIYDVAEKSRVTTVWLRLWLFGLFLGVFILGVMTARLYFEGKAIEGKIIEAQVAIFGQSTLVTAQAQKLQTLTMRVLSVLETRRSPAETLRVIRDSKSNQIQLTHYVYDFKIGQIVLNGRAENRTDLITFREKLESSGRFATVRIPLSSLEKERNADFTVILNEK